ncbi:MAG: hypothetical protein H7836_12485 [Magnetococcus sp. YQC-3]
MKVQKLIQELRFQKELDEYFSEVEDVVLDLFESEEDQEKVFKTINTILENNELDLDQKIKVINNLLEEAIGQVQRPQQFMQKPSAAIRIANTKKIPPPSAMAASNVRARMVPSSGPTMVNPNRLR